MVSREHKKGAGAGTGALHEKLQLLRSITNSHAQNDTSIILDATKYIEELKNKVETLNKDGETAESSSQNHRNSWPVVAVETMEKGFMVNIQSEKNRPGLLVAILAVFEELGLNVIEATISCKDTFQLQALGGDHNDEIGEGINAQVVKQAVSEAIVNYWNNEPD